ncbi:MAG: hypothetical protein ACYSUV_06385, partial [Planctomycetota bacterium]
MADTTAGIIKCIGKQQFAIRSADRSYRPGLTEVMVHPDLTRGLALIEGAAVTGKVEPKKGKPKLVSIESLGGMLPEDFR